MKNNLIYICAALAVISISIFAPSCANTTQAPTGGAKDTIPPLIVNIVPLPGAVDFPRQGGKIVFTFNEYITIKNPKNIFLSPPQEKSPVTKLRNKDLVITFEEPLDSNTTYTIDFIDALADNNEGNMHPGYTYVFSTGHSIDSMVFSGEIVDCSTLKPVKGATVMLYDDLADSALFLKRPRAAAKTDSWGFFVLPFLRDTVYRMYAIKDENNNNIYDPDTEIVGFVDSVIRPTVRVRDSLPELFKYDMTDTLMCEARNKEFRIKLFREKPSKQFLRNNGRISDRAAFISFMAPDVWIDSLWFRGYKANEIISEFNITQDSLLLWINSRKPAPDTLHLFVNYRKTDSLGRALPFLEHLKMTMPEGKKTKSHISKRNLTHDDTVCVYKLEAKPETVEQNGFSLDFEYPIIKEGFDKLKFRIVNPKQVESFGVFNVEKDSMNLRHFILRPKDKLSPGFEYYFKVPAGAFTDINGLKCDSTEVKVTLPTDDKLSQITFKFSNVDRKIIVELLNEGKDKVFRTYTINSDADLRFPYLTKGKYYLRITDDGNRNSIVDTGSILEHRQPENVVFFSMNGKELIEIPPSAEIEQKIDLLELFK